MLGVYGGKGVNEHHAWIQGTFGTATTNANSNGGTGEAGRVSHQWENDDQLMTKVEESTNTSDTHADAVVQDVVV